MLQVSQFGFHVAIFVLESIFDIVWQKEYCAFLRNGSLIL